MENQITMTKAIVVGVNHTTDELFNYQLQELIALCEARDIEVIDTLVQNLPHPNNATYLGSGKLEELKNLKDIYDAELIVFIEELSPIQLRNIGNYLDVEIIDRTMLILEIFETRAKTIEAKLQVEIANLKYMLPRLVGSYVHLSRTGGGGGGGAGARRGSGETKLEEDRRHIERRINKASEELEKVVIARKTSRKMRASNEVKTVAFVGYTNAGKSSTMNTLLTMFDKEAEKQVFVKDMLFATLETSTRAIKLPTNEEFLITDTVGFVSNLPHHLIESFKSTLEEIKEASLIVHVVDASSPYSNLHIKTTNDVLNSLGCSHIDTVYLLNKADLVTNQIFLPKVDKDSIVVSNKTKEGFNELLNYIKEKLFSNTINSTFLIPYQNGEVFNTLKEKANIHSFSYENDGILVDVTLSNHLYGLYKKYEKPGN